MEDYNYDLPADRIAQEPLAKRDRSKLLVYNKGYITDNTFSEILNHIPPGSLMVFNNSKVIRARLFFRKETGALIELLLLEPSCPTEYSTVFAEKSMVEWKCIAGNLKKWKSEVLASELNDNGETILLKAEKVSANGSELIVRFTWNGGIPFGKLLELAGHIPLPPYIARPDHGNDSIRYQTVYSKEDGSVAAPTAGLHFTQEILDGIDLSGKVTRQEITLHVGAGTFMPVKSDYISGHRMHREHYSISISLINSLIANEGRIISVGTTSARALESIYWLGIRLLAGKGDTGEYFTSQWEPYSNSDLPAVAETLVNLRDYMHSNNLGIISASTSIIIVPGYRFRIVNGLVTNFHQPGSTLLLLISAFTGKGWRDIYKHALNSGYRFLSYGDSSLLLP